MDARSTLALSHPNNSLQGKRKPGDCASATRMDAGTSIALSAQAREDFHEPTGVGNRDYHLAIVRTPSPDDEFFAIHDGCVRRALIQSARSRHCIWFMLMLLLVPLTLFAWFSLAFGKLAPGILVLVLPDVPLPTV